MFQGDLIFFIIFKFKMNYLYMGIFNRRKKVIPRLIRKTFPNLNMKMRNKVKLNRSRKPFKRKSNFTISQEIENQTRHAKYCE